jgi:hypothetical protein
MPPRYFLHPPRPGLRQEQGQRLHLRRPIAAETRCPELAAAAEPDLVQRQRHLAQLTRACVRGRAGQCMMHKLCRLRFLHGSGHTCRCYHGRGLWPTLFQGACAQACIRAARASPRSCGGHSVDQKSPGAPGASAGSTPSLTASSSRVGGLSRSCGVHGTPPLIASAVLQHSHADAFGGGWAPRKASRALEICCM